MNGETVSRPSAASMVQLAGAGDEAAFAQLVATYHADMARVAYVVCGDSALAQDAVQSAWLVAWRKLDSLRDPERIRPWLLSVTVNETRQLVRRRRGPVVEIDVHAPADPRDDPSSVVEQLDLRRALAHLSPEDRALLAMRYVTGLGSDELGTAIGTSASTARTRLSRIVERLRKELRND